MVSSNYHNQIIVIYLHTIMHHTSADKTYWEKAWGELYKNATSYIEQILETTPYEITTVRPLISHL